MQSNLIIVLQAHKFVTICVWRWCRNVQRVRFWVHYVCMYVCMYVFFLNIFIGMLHYII